MQRKLTDTMSEARKNLKAYDAKHGKWNVDLHCYQKGTSNGKASAKATPRS